MNKRSNVLRLGFTPDFLPAALLPFWALMERLLEKVPGLRKVCVHNVVVLEK
jgi:hypothetical protein